MNKLVAGMGVMIFFGLSGCATKGYVHSQTDPMADRIAALESKVTTLEAMSGKPALLSDADKALIKQANDKAQQALDATGKLSVEVGKVNEAAKNAETAAQNAQAAAQNAQTAEKKSEKLFQLEQKK